MKRPPVDERQVRTTIPGPIKSAEEKIDWQLCDRVYNLFRLNCEVFGRVSYRSKPDICTYLSGIKSADGKTCVELLNLKEFDLVNELVKSDLDTSD